MKHLLYFTAISAMLVACSSPATPLVQQVPLPVTVQATVEVTRIVEVTRVVTATPDPTSTQLAQQRIQVIHSTPNYFDQSWKFKSIVPNVDPAMKAVYARGLALGNDPRSFSKVGDCNSESEFFLKSFDFSGTYNLGPYTKLQNVIDNFTGSFSRTSMAARTGFGPNAMFASIWADPTVCLVGEGPLPCEYRLHRPSIALIGLGTHYEPLSDFEGQMRAVIEFSLDHGVVPILATKVDNEGGDEVNAIIVNLAQEYQVPLWNFWLAEQPLPNQGQPPGDGVHFNWAENDFGSIYSLRNGWPVRNLTALQALDAVWSAIQE